MMTIHDYIVIGECHSNKIDESIGQRYKVIGSVKDREAFIEFSLYTVLYHPPPPSTACPSGLSVCQSERVTGKLPLTSEVLLTRKLGILNVINTMDVAPELVYSLYIAASSDSQEAVVKRGEVLLKKMTASVNLEDCDLIKRLFLLFNGHVSGTNDIGIAAESRVTPGSYTLKLRLMSIFCRSIKAANSFPSTLQCIFSCIYGTGTTTRLKQLGMEFAVWVFKHVRI
ncbi:hypothetical protein ZOSMA_180G00100 [Zostera marina]|uniref:Proteasome component Ecm29 N-terminal domain-containing protein n=1 Tax=Zostera marina TaxID=29655 RepID=A0A0K9PR28_ZOSMR|nr:hypothetical protein ZOSMA_180G00100 [Zostera marina]